MRSAALHNLGCKVNAYETEAMQQLLEEAGYLIVPFTEKADVYIINTCSVTNMADHKSRQMIHRARALNPEAVVVAAGCYVQVAEESLKSDLSVDILIGNNRKRDLVDILDRFFEMRASGTGADTAENADMPGCPGTFADVPDIGDISDYEELSVKRPAERTRAFIKIQDGCNQFCSYCIIPYARGRVRSRGPKEVLDEAAALAEQGYKEIVLTGIHLSSYGIDFSSGTDGPLPSADPPLLDLIKRLNDIDGIKRIRLSSLEPRIITPGFVKALSGMEKICPHFHLSLQSGCDATLRRMNRHYNTAEYAEKCALIRASFEHPAVTTDVIVGFPGETEDEFFQTQEFLSSIGFYEMHIFKYSRRAGTRADKMEGQVAEKVKTARSSLLFGLEKEMSAEFRSWYIGKECEVLPEELVTIDGRDYWTGYTKEYVRAAVPAQAGARNILVRGRADSFVSEDTLLLATP